MLKIDIILTRGYNTTAVIFKSVPKVITYHMGFFFAIFLGIEPLKRANIKARNTTDTRKTTCAQAEKPSDP
ncbi:MAG: hypothetical protein LUD77_10130 [Clostridiales bacterium]|nr:hypothetical protein [Clostridiales bacterium]